MSADTAVGSSRPSPASTVYDAVVVGAGPYGLSTAAHLHGHRLNVVTFGKPLDLWRNHMPKGMRLRSHWWATNLSDPDGLYGFERFLSGSRHKKGYPMPIDAFVEYGLWFQERAVPNVDDTYVSSLERHGAHFRLILEDGREVHSAAVVMALGLAYYAHRPGEFTHLPVPLVSHSCDHNDCTRFAGKTVVVVGGGQSAIEYAALLHEAGATVHVVSRRPLFWLAPDRTNERSMLERILAPNATIATGWPNRVLDTAPYLFYQFRQDLKDRFIHSHYTAAASDWLRGRVIGNVILHEACSVATLDAVNGHVHVTLSDGDAIKADHVILATGYRVDINKLTMIHPSLRAAIQTDSAIPTLNAWFESSVPGLYFIGLTSLRAFGPLYRFVAGCPATARRVARAVAHTRSNRPLALAGSKLSPATQS